MPQRITLDPDPPQAGKPCTICYDFTGLELKDTKIVITYVPPGGEDSVVLLPAANCADITVAAATSMHLEDTSGESPELLVEIDN